MKCVTMGTNYVGLITTLENVHPKNESCRPDSSEGKAKITRPTSDVTMETADICSPETRHRDPWADSVQTQVDTV